MSRHAGVLRDAAGLDQAAAVLDEVIAGIGRTATAPSQSAFEATNVVTVARAMLAAAAARTESRGCHRRTRPSRHVAGVVDPPPSSPCRSPPATDPVSVTGGPLAPVTAR